MRSGSSQKWFLLTALYLAQGLPYGFFTQALPALLREMHVSRPAIGMSYLLTLPWALKFLWAPLVDRYCFPRLGLRRSWILPLQVFAAVFLTALGFFEPRTALPVVLVGFLLLNLCAASQDIATDGWAVDLLEKRERGLANGIQVAGYRLGMIIGGGLMLVVFSRFGWQLTMWAMAVLIVLATIPVLATRETDLPRNLPKARFKDSIAFAFRPGAYVWILILLLYKAAHAFATGMLRPFLIDQGYSLENIATLLGGVGFTAGLLGALAGGYWIGKAKNRRKTLIAFGLLQLSTVALYFFLALPIPNIASYLICAVEHFTSGMATAALFTVMMDMCRHSTAAADYTFQASVVVISTGAAGAFSGLSAEALGYGGHFTVAGITGAVFLGAIIFLNRRPAIQSLAVSTG